MTIASSEILDRLLRVRHIALDLDGTCYRGENLFHCTLPFLKQLRELGIGYSFVTNNTSLSRHDYVSKLNSLGIPVTAIEINTPAETTSAWLKEFLPDAWSIAVLGTPSLCRQFEQAGWQIDWDDPGAVVVGYDTTLTYERLCRAAYWIRQGRPFLATHPDLVCPTDAPTVLVDCGALCACLTAATGREPIVFGKPSPAMLLAICKSLQLHPEELAMVGDRLYTDVAMAKQAGALSVLVLTGEATPETACHSTTPPDIVLTDLEALGKSLVQLHGENKASSPLPI